MRPNPCAPPSTAGDRGSKMSRASIVGMLIAAEVLVVGMAIYAVGRGSTSFAAGMHQVDFSASPIAPLAAGGSPHVVIDDPLSRVVVTPSSDQLVHVTDLTQIHGAFFSGRQYPHLEVTRTPDGVRIVRPQTDHLSFNLFGFSIQRIAVEVPENARLEIAQCSGADVTGVAGGVSTRSVDGHIALADLRGSIDARTDDGSITAKNVQADTLALASSDGRLEFDDVNATTLTGSTRDGRIVAQRLSVANDATLETDDGSVRIGLAPGANLTIDASTRDGSIAVDGDSYAGDDGAARSIRVGAGTGHMKLTTGDGSIHIYTNGELQDHGL
jgi:hypothetical protein